MTANIEEKALVVVTKDDDKFNALKDVLKKTKFFDLVEQQWKSSNKSKVDFRIVIKPNIMMAYSKSDPSSITDPELVEAMIDQLQDHGYSNVTVVESQNVYGNWFRKRDVLTVAQYFGYSMKNYKIVDLTIEKVKHVYTSKKLGEHWIGPTWRDADFRISFAKNKTHFNCYYTLTLKNLYGTLPLQNKFKEYHQKLEFDWPTIEMLKDFPCHFGLIDAIWSADGLMGLKQDTTPVHTKCVIGGANIVAVAAAGARKMGLNPKVSKIYQLAVEAWGNPDIEWVGNQTVYPKWQNVPPVIDELFDFAEEFYHVANPLGFVTSEMDPFFKPKIRSYILLFIRKIVLKIMRLFGRGENQYAKWYTQVTNQLEER